MRRLAAALALAAALVAPAAAATDTPPAEVEPDRPDQTSRPTTLSRGSVQLETGVVYEHTRESGPDDRAFRVEAVLRFGITDRFELRLESEPFVQQWGSDDDSGFGDLTLSARYRFLDAREDSPWPALAVQPFVKLPTAQDPIGTERVDFGFTLIAGFDLPAGFQAAVNAGVAAIGQRDPDGYLVQATASGGIGRSIIPNTLGGYVEVLYASRDERDGRDRVAIGTGVAWKISRRLVLDLGFEKGVSGAGPDYVVRSGLSLLLRP